ncbi:MAG: DUF488 family protein [Spirochaetia bacterium]|jgi:hypothetical protein
MRYTAELRAKRSAIKSLIDLWQRRGKDVVLFCYERQPGERPCHRTLLARWITRTFGIEVSEVQT